MFLKTFGRNPTGKRLARIEQSPNYRNGAFQNAEPTEVTLKDTSFLKMLRKIFNKPATATPSHVLPSVKTNLHTLSAEEPVIVWFGHSSYFIKHKGFTILVDPVFSGHASPVSFFGRAFKGTGTYTVADMPDIDLLVITHDHYDHLDFDTIIQLKGKVKKIVTSLGVGSHLEYWGVDTMIVTELDWWQQTTIAADIDITATPARHFSGRVFTRGKTLWSSFVLNLHSYRLFLGGDSGYDSQFKAIGDKLGPFDVALLECGQYGDEWPYIHMHPKEIVTAATDLRAKAVLPVHWAKFSLSYHPWNEPVQQFTAAAKNSTFIVATPEIGQPYSIGTSMPVNKWWKIN